LLACFNSARNRETFVQLEGQNIVVL